MAASQELTPFGDALAGALGGVFSNAVVYPLDTAKTRIQAATSSRAAATQRERSMLKLLIRILREEGLGGFYKGFFASMLNTFSQQYAYFFFYSLVRGAYLKRLTARAKTTAAPVISTAAELALGAVAGALAQIFTIPVSVIATRQQVSDKEHESFLDVGRQIVREDGPQGLWRGLRPGLVLTSNPAITYGAYARLCAILVPGQTRLPPWGAFALGAASKTLATIVTYPYIMAKVRIQARPDAPGAISVLRAVWKAEGPLGWYQGMGAQITKAVLSQALLFASKDQFEQYALALLVLWARMQGNLPRVPLEKV